MSKNDGGPAFPVTPEHFYAGSNIPSRGIGMSLRDYFAVAALQGMLSFPGAEAIGCVYTNSDPASVSAFAYQYADAMLAERAKEAA